MTKRCYSLLFSCYSLPKECHALDGILPFLFYLPLHSLNGALIEEGHQEFGAVVVEEF